MKTYCNVCNAEFSWTPLGNGSIEAQLTCPFCQTELSPHRNAGEDRQMTELPVKEKRGHPAGSAPQFGEETIFQPRLVFESLLSSDSEEGAEILAKGSPKRPEVVVAPGAPGGIGGELLDTNPVGEEQASAGLAQAAADAPTPESQGPSDRSSESASGTDPILDQQSIPDPSIDRSDKMEACLVLGRASNGVECLPLAAVRTVVGRRGALEGPERPDLTIDDPTVSGRHIQIDMIGNEFFIRDLNSRNGTFLSGRKVRFCQLLPGDEVRIGKTVLIFQTQSTEAA